jgi:hypothetical protein
LVDVFVRRARGSLKGDRRCIDRVHATTRDVHVAGNVRELRLLLSVRSLSAGARCSRSTTNCRMKGSRLAATGS